MARKIERGDAVKLAGKVDKIWPNGLVTVHLRGYDYPVTLHADVIAEIIQGPPEKPVGGKRKFYDKPDDNQPH
jgi:hypothetical protein